MLGFLFKSSKKLPSNSSQKNRAVDPFQRQLAGLQTPRQEKQPPPKVTSVRQIEDEVNEEVKAFQSHVKEMKETSLKLEELTKMLKSGEIPDNAYKVIIGELGDHLSMSVREIFNLREMLELARAKAKLDWAKEKIGLKEFEVPEGQMIIKDDAYLRRELYSSLYKCEDVISKIDSTLSSLTMEEEASIIEQYLSLIKERFIPRAASDEIERARAACQQRLDSISEKWASIRRDRIENVMNLELKASQIKDDIKEVEVRFSVGELNQSTYEYKMSGLHGSLRNIEKEISDIRKHVDEIEMKMFRCAELLRENP